jgi:hypothetical protein
MSHADFNRRSFLQSAVGAGVSLAASQTTRAAAPTYFTGPEMKQVSANATASKMLGRSLWSV